MIMPFEVHGYVMPKGKTDFIKLIKPMPSVTDDLYKISELLRNSDIEHFIIEVRRNPLWEEFSRSRTSMDNGDSGSK